MSYYEFTHSHLTYGVIKWGDSSSLEIQWELCLQKKKQFRVMTDEKIGILQEDI